MVRSVSFTPYGGDTIKALQARQLALQKEAPQLPAVANMRSPWQGASHLANTFVNTLQQNAAIAQEREARKQLSSLIGGHDPGTDWTGQDIGQATALDEDVGIHLMDLQAAKELAASKQEHWTPLPTPEGETGQWYRSDISGETKKIGGSTDSSAWKPSDIAGRADDYMKAAAVYNDAAPSWQSMQDAAKIALDQSGDAAGRGAADHNLVVGYAKLLDPKSVVREGEVTSATMTDGEIGQIKSWLNQWTENGGSLTDEIRRGIMVQASSRMAAYHKQASDYRNWIVDVSKRNNVNSDDVVPPLGAFTPWAETPPPDQPPADPDQPPADPNNPPVPEAPADLENDPQYQAAKAAYLKTGGTENGWKYVKDWKLFAPAEPVQ